MVGGDFTQTPLKKLVRKFSMEIGMKELGMLK